MLEVQELTKIYSNGKQSLIAVNRATLSIQKGEMAIIMGPSGSGKTTLISMIGGLSRPTSGFVKISGKEITSLDHSAIAKFRSEHIGFVFQNFKLLNSLNAEENVMLPMCCLQRHSHTKALTKAREMLDTLGLHDRKGFPINKLSGGEKQRVAIARALINNPSLILADEPTASLDSNTGKTVAELLRNIAKKDNRTVAVVSHDPRILPFADRIFKVEDGMVVEGEA